MKPSLVDFENDNDNSKIINARKGKISELMNLETNEFDEKYQIISLKPLTEIIKIKFAGYDTGKYRIYAVQEIINNTNSFFAGELNKLNEARSALTQKNRLINNYIESIKPLNKKTVHDVAQSPITLDMKKKTYGASQYGYHKEIIAVISKDNDLLKKDFKEPSSEEYYEITEYADEEGLVTRITE